MTSTDIAVPFDPDEIIGLEDYDETTDSVMPRLVIDKSGVIKDSLSGREWTELRCVVLGVVKGRVLWDADLDNNEHPLCKSKDFKGGNPYRKEFPWGSSGFSEADYPDGSLLPCEACHLKDWGTHPQGKKPWCAEQHTYVIMIEYGEGVFGPAILTIQRTAVAPSRAYMSAFRNEKKAMFVSFTTITLDSRKKGSNVYAVPEFKRGEDTDPAYYPEWANRYRGIRDMLTSWRGDDDDAPVSVVETPVAAPTAPAPQPQAQPTQVQPQPVQTAPAPIEDAVVVEDTAPAPAAAPVQPAAQPAGPAPAPFDEPLDDF